MRLIRMRSYTNKKGEVVTVGENHLETALLIKQKLQKDSPSNRCSWGKHHKMMKKEGFADSENSENYRQMIKAYQKSIGELPSVTKYADMVASKKIESYKELVGEVTWEKQENQKYLRDIRKGKKEIIEEGLMIEALQESVRNVLSDVDFKSLSSIPFLPHTHSSQNRMIVTITDWHIGCIVDVKGNKFNYEVAKERINYFLEEVMQRAYERKVYRIDVVFMGDAVEHAYMRNSQGYSVEFPLAEQMVRCARLISEFLLKLSEKHFTTFRAFAGNHDRMSGDKNSAISGDNAMVVINEIVETIINSAGRDNLMFVKCCDAYSAKMLDINGRNFKFVHGDKVKKDNFKKIKEHSADDGITYDAIVYGHFHHFMCLSVGINKWEIRVGSIKGSDDYSLDLGLGSSPSQAMIIVNEKGQIEPICIELD